MEMHLVLVVLLSLCSLGFSKECTKELQKNVDFPGTDILQTYASDAEHCQKLCTDHHACLFFTFIRSDWTRDKRNFYCYLKFTESGVPQVITSLFGVTSGYSLRLCSPEWSEPFMSTAYQNVDFFGADYRTLFTANFEDCQRICTEDIYCQFFTFVNEDFTPENIRFKCHLKYSWIVPRPPVIKALANVVSGFSHNFQMPSSVFDKVCEGNLFPQVDIVARTFEEVPAFSDKHCQALCSVHPLCTYFSFVSESLLCRLKDNPHEMVLQAKSGVTSGIPARGCQLNDSWYMTPVKGVDFRGADMRYTMVRSAEACQTACNEEPKCQFYTYVQENFSNRAFRGRCYLKRTITIPSPPKIAKLQNVVSGFSASIVP